MGEKGGVEEFFLGNMSNINVNLLTEYRKCTISDKCYWLRATSPFRVASERASEGRSREGPRKRTVFIFVRDRCIVIIIAHSIPSVPVTPKAFVKSWHLLWLSTSEQERTKLRKLVFSQTRQFQSLSRDLSPIIGRNRSVSIGKNQSSSKLKSIPVLF